MDLTIRGIQDNGVQACAKHYIGYEQKTQRSNTTTADGKNVDGYSANIDDRTLHELYLSPFANAVRAGVASVMCSYNRLNRTYSCENSHTLNEILKGELGFRGFVMSDFFATHSGVTSALAGLDMDMPSPTAQTTLGETFFGPNIISAVQNGSLSEARADDMVSRVLTPYYYPGQDENYPSVDPTTELVIAAPSPSGRNVRSDHARLIRQLAAGTVLLKNVNSTLPLRSPRVIGVFGNDAADVSDGLAFDRSTGSLTPPFGFDIGTLTIGGGSGGGRNPYIVSTAGGDQSAGEEGWVARAISY